MTKKLGSYFTPEPLLKFSLGKLDKLLLNQENITVLEPSCGDGRFILEAFSHFQDKVVDATLVEIDKNSIALAKSNLGSALNAEIHENDFLFYEDEKKDYDLIIGNPPYINKKLLSTNQVDQIRSILREENVNSRVDKNIWPAFVIKSTQMLSSTGTLCMVLPFDLLQVRYGEDVQAFLESNFELIQIYNIKGRSFDSADQSTLVLVASKKSEEKGLFYEEIHNLNIKRNKKKSAAVRDRKYQTTKSNFKWSSLTLSDSDLTFLDAQAKKQSAVGNYIHSKPGLVTAANNFFIVNRETLLKYRMSNYAKPVIQKGSMVNGEAIVTTERYEQIRDQEKPCYFLDFTNYRRGRNKGVDQYLDYGESLNIHQRYKCSLREDWYKVPIVDPGEALFFKRCHIYPKLLSNQNYYTTDSAYNINARDGYDIQSFISSFYNPLTLCFAELMGRHYGGGVLELTPNEFRSLPLPYHSIDDGQFKQFLSDFASKNSILECVSSQATQEMISPSGISINGFKRLNRIYKKLVTSRISNAM